MVPIIWKSQVVCQVINHRLTIRPRNFILGIHPKKPQNIYVHEILAHTHALFITTEKWDQLKCSLTNE